VLLINNMNENEKYFYELMERYEYYFRKENEMMGIEIDESRTIEDANKLLEEAMRGCC